MKIRELLNWSSESLTNSSSPDIDAWVLIKFVLQVDDAWLIANEQTSIDAQNVVQIQKLVESRKHGIPVAYLTNSQEFWSKNLYVDSRVLVPRSETETLVEIVLRFAQSIQSPTILELGTGSGAIAIALSSELPHAKVIATDISQDALAVATTNFKNWKSTNVDIIKADWFVGLETRRFDLICSNPPYVACNDPHLEQLELQYEPKFALISGEDGLDAMRQIVREAPDYLHSNGWLILEHAYHQAIQVQAIMESAHFEDIHSEKDLTGHFRVSCGRKSG
ncbi:MAG: peptide chain release factor N(5)-glutamine methyltransferase [Gammaproteobacteria bacterium]|nr:peptide chain release factor N(5)-glutamine methyltransferase [Gammaproteobacteria bacterium]MCY4274988.1 peptide chain release factor N(5)-glutamine methyltransferase [Gammaproteobacteria bacterium]